MNFYGSLLLVAVAVTVAHMAYGVPTPGKTDAAKIQKNMAKNKCEYTRDAIIIIVVVNYCR